MSRAAFQGSVTNIRNLSSHKTVALTIEFPQEMAQEIVQAFGWPNAVSPVPVAVARLVQEPLVPESLNAISKALEEGRFPGQIPKEERAKREWQTLALVTRAGILANDPVFMDYVGVTDAEEAADHIRKVCGVQSRKDIRYGTGAAADYLALEQAFWAWRDEPSDDVAADHD